MTEFWPGLTRPSGIWSCRRKCKRDDSSGLEFAGLSVKFTTGLFAGNMVGVIHGPDVARLESAGGLEDALSSPPPGSWTHPEQGPKLCGQWENHTRQTRGASPLSAALAISAGGGARLAGRHRHAPSSLQTMLPSAIKCSTCRWKSGTPTRDPQCSWCPFNERKYR